MYFTVYKITNIVNEKIYIGVHKTNNLDDGYMGSGLAIKRSIKKYGIENFVKEYLEIFNNPEDMYSMESKLVNRKFVDNYQTYNIKCGGFGGWDHVDCLEGRKQADLVLKEKYGDDWRSIISKFGAEKAAERLNNRRLDQKYKEEESLRLLSYRHLANTPDANLKRKETFSKNKHQQGARNSQYGSMWITNGIKNKKIMKDEEIPNGWRKGRVIIK